MQFSNPDPVLLKEKKLFIFDMDGTIYLGCNVFDYAIRFINNLRANGKKVLFFTNNASHTTAFYQTKLAKLGFSPAADEIMTSGDVTIEFLKRHRPGKSVYLVGTDELVENFRAAGIPMLSAEVTMIPQNYVTLTDETAVKNLQKTLDLLEDDDDVQAVYHNWDE